MSVFSCTSKSLSSTIDPFVVLLGLKGEIFFIIPNLQRFTSLLNLFTMAESIHEESIKGEFVRFKTKKVLVLLCPTIMHDRKLPPILCSKAYDQNTPVGIGTGHSMRTND